MRMIVTVAYYMSILRIRVMFYSLVVCYEISETEFRSCEWSYMLLPYSFRNSALEAPDTLEILKVGFLYQLCAILSLL